MSQFYAPVPLEKAYVLLNHGPVTLVSSAHAGQRNVMAASWAMPLDFSPPKVVVIIDRNAYSRELIEASGEFVLNIPFRAIADKVLAVGSETGRDIDKFAACGLQAAPASQVAVPLVSGCAAALECRVLAEPENQKKYDLFIGEVVAAWADRRVFAEGRWSFPSDELRTIHYVAGGAFFQTGEVFEAG